MSSSCFFLPCDDLFSKFSTMQKKIMKVRLCGWDDVIIQFEIRVVWCTMTSCCVWSYLWSCFDPIRCIVIGTLSEFIRLNCRYANPTSSLSQFSSVASFVYVRIHIHLIEKKLSGKKHKSLTMRPNGALGNMKNCLYSWTRVHYNSTACLNLLFQLSWKENILKNQESKRNIVTNLPLSSSQSSIVSQLSIVYTFHPRTLFQTGVYFQLQICHFSFFVTQPSKSFIFHLSMNFLFRVYPFPPKFLL